MTTKAKGTSIRQRLIIVSVEIGVPFQILETAFILERPGEVGFEAALNRYLEVIAL